MKKFTIKYKLSLLIFIYLALIASGVYFLVRPLIQKIRTQAYNIQTKSIDREIEKAEIRKLPEIEKEWNDYDSQRESLDVILGKSDQVSFIENVESIADKTGNKINLKIEDSKKDVGFIARSKDILKGISYPDYFPIEINLEGDYGGLVNFMHLLENSHFYVNVIAISSSRNMGNNNPFSNNSLGVIGGASSRQNNSQQDNTKPTIKTDITAIVYMQKQ